MAGSARVLSALILPSLVEALRMQHGPVHYDFRMRYVNRELPPRSWDDSSTSHSSKTQTNLAAKYEEALAWFHEAIDAVDERQVRRQILES
jgi:hypothetical protein